MRQLLNPYLNNFKLLILISCVITSCYSYNPIYNQPSKTSLNPRLENYMISFESELNSELQSSKENLENFVLKDIHNNIITNNSDEKEAQSGNIYLCTANAQAAIKQQCLDLGIGFMEKPIDVERVIAPFKKGA